jgi:N-acetylneuraminic acid mutarotase
MKNLISIIVLIFAIQSNIFCQNWDTLAKIPVGLTFPVVVALNGEIHVMGGGATGGATDIHLRYKPSTNKWDTLAPVPYKAQQPAGAVLNGKIHYFGGGYPNSGSPLKSHYVYNPDSNKWTVAAPLPIARAIMKAAAINGKIYAITGQPEKARADEYNPATNTWTSKNSLPDNNFWYSAIVVRNNEIFRFGGGGYTAPVNSVHKYDTISDSWISIATLSKSLHAPAGTAMGSLIYITGGYNAGETKVTQIFDVNTLQFQTGLPLPSARSYHEMVTIDSCIYSVGGSNSSYPDMNTSLLRNCHPVVVSIDDMIKDNSLNVYPNPATEFITFGINTASVLNVELFDLYGAKVMSFKVKSGAESIDIRELKDGIYFYRAGNGFNCKTYTGKISVVR